MEDKNMYQKEHCPPGLQLEQLSINDYKCIVPELQNAAQDFAFAFDIDGVLMRGKVPLPGSKDVLKMLHTNSIPFILLTNGGGLTEVDHAEHVSQRLSMQIEQDQFVQSHSPFKMFVNQYKDEWIVVLGGTMATVKELATRYGFSRDRIISTSDIAKHYPSIHPFSEMTTNYHDQHGSIVNGFSHEKEIAAVFVFTSPRDWCLDLQVCLDLLLSTKGKLGTRSALNGNPDLPNHGYQQDGQPQIFWCNPDLEWATPHSIPRLAQGGFRAALEGVWASVTKGKAVLHSWTCGKPTSTTYEFAEQVLNKYRQKVDPHTTNPLKTVYMIGDNPESDICGALYADKASDLAWKSVLVETGVHKAGSVPAFPPTHVTSSVWEAVRWAVEQETKADIGNYTDG